MPVYQNEYVIVNIWTSKHNKALPGANCGHVSLTINDGKEETYVSFWPGELKPYKNTNEFFHSKEDVVRKKFSNIVTRQVSYKKDYDEDCVLEAYYEKNVEKLVI